MNPETGLLCPGPIGAHPLVSEWQLMDISSHQHLYSDGSATSLLTIYPCIFPASICILMTDNSLSQPDLVLYSSFMYDTNLNRKPSRALSGSQRNLSERGVRDQHKVPLQLIKKSDTNKI